MRGVKSRSNSMNWTLWGRQVFGRQTVSALMDTRTGSSSSNWIYEGEHASIGCGVMRALSRAPTPDTEVGRYVCE